MIVTDKVEWENIFFCNELNVHHIFVENHYTQLQLNLIMWSFFYTSKDPIFKKNHKILKDFKFGKILISLTGICIKVKIWHVSDFPKSHTNKSCYTGQINQHKPRDGWSPTNPLNNHLHSSHICVQIFGNFDFDFITNNTFIDHSIH